MGIWESWKEQEGEESEETDHPDDVPPTQPLSFTFIRLLFTIPCQFYRPALSCSARITPPFPLPSHQSFPFPLISFSPEDQLTSSMGFRRLSLLRAGAALGYLIAFLTSHSLFNLWPQLPHLSSFPSCLHLLFTSLFSLTTHSLFFLCICTSGS